MIISQIPRIGWSHNDTELHPCSSPTPTPPPPPPGTSPPFAFSSPPDVKMFLGRKFFLLFFLPTLGVEPEMSSLVPPSSDAPVAARLTELELLSSSKNAEFETDSLSSSSSSSSWAAAVQWQLIDRYENS